jgi:hypothetical protein
MYFKIVVVLVVVVGYWNKHALARNDAVFTTGFTAGASTSALR